jgi:hypothetical protein
MVNMFYLMFSATAFSWKSPVDTLLAVGSIESHHCCPLAAKYTSLPSLRERLLSYARENRGGRGMTMIVSQMESKKGIYSGVRSEIRKRRRCRRSTRRRA